MKKLLALICALCLTVSFAGCGKKEENKKVTSSTPSSSSSDTLSTDSENQSDTSSEDNQGSFTSSEANGGVSGNNETNSQNSQTDNNQSAGQTTPVETDKKTAKVTDKLKRGINMSGPLESVDVKYDSWIFNPDYYAQLASKGFDHIRLPVNFGNFIGEAPDYYIETEFLRAVDLAINCALDAGLCVVLDFHGWAGTLASDFNGNKECFYKIWEQLSARYQSYPEELMFELVNEPNKPITNEQLNELQMETVKRIRKLNPTRTIALATNENNGCWNLWNTQVPANDENIIISIHNYDTMVFTHQGANWIGPGYENKVHLDDDIKAAVKGNLEYCKAYQERTGRRVWISEWGVYQGIADKSDITQYADYFSKICKENNLAYCYWEFGGGYGLYDLTAGEFKDFLINYLH